MKKKKQLLHGGEVSSSAPVRDAAVPIAASGSDTPVGNELRALSRPDRLLLLGLFLGLTYDFLFWGQSDGINVAILLGTCVTGTYTYFRSEGYKPAPSSLWLLIPAGFFAASIAWRQEPLAMFLAKAILILCIALLATSYCGGGWYLYRISDYWRRLWLLIGDGLNRPIIFLKSLGAASSSSEEEHRFSMLGVIRGLLIAIPVLFFFGALLASADLVFQQQLNSLFQTHSLVDLLGRFLLICLFAFLFIGISLHSLERSQDEKAIEEGTPIVKPLLGVTEAFVVLGAVLFLFLSFVLVQFQYFFGGETNIGVEGYTYSQYARRGFNELVMVAFFSLVLILGLHGLTRRPSERQRTLYSGMSAGVVSLVLVILLSAYQRISLAIDWHGFSRLRLYPRIFLVWLGLLLVVVAVLEMRRRERYFAFAALLASMGFALSVTLVNVDGAIVRHNVARTLAGKHLNVAHLASLSADAVPALAKEFYSGAYSGDIQEGIGAALTCYLHDASDEPTSLGNWPSFHLARWRAHLALEEVERDLQDYGINDDSPWNVKVRTPSNVWYACHYYDSGREE